MGTVVRRHTRYSDFGKVECPAICLVHGVLDDISKSGCKVHFDAPISISLEKDYEIRFRLSHSAQEPMLLVCHPQWIKENKGSASVGFAILRSPDTAKLESYIMLLHSDLTEDVDQDYLPKEEPCQFV